MLIPLKNANSPVVATTMCDVCALLSELPLLSIGAGSYFCV